MLRERLALTGTKVSCDVQVCGACTVLVDGLAVSACTYLAVDADGRAVGTVEGLARDGAAHPLQQAFLDHAAFQCGFCTPGMLMAATALLEENPTPTREEVVARARGQPLPLHGLRADRRRGPRGRGDGPARRRA